MVLFLVFFLRKVYHKSSQKSSNINGFNRFCINILMQFLQV